MHDKNVQWVNVTANTLLTDRPCWLHYANLSASAEEDYFDLYAGHDANAKKIVRMASVLGDSMEFHPAKPVFCPQGLYVAIGAASGGAFIQWELDDGSPARGAPAPAAEPAG